MNTPEELTPEEEATMRNWAVSNGPKPSHDLSEKSARIREARKLVCKARALVEMKAQLSAALLAHAEAEMVLVEKAAAVRNATMALWELSHPGKPYYHENPAGR